MNEIITTVAIEKESKNITETVKRESGEFSYYCMTSSLLNMEFQIFSEKVKEKFPEVEIIEPKVEEKKETVTKTGKRKVVTKMRKIFPGYFFVKYKGELPQELDEIFESTKGIKFSRSKGIIVKMSDVDVVKLVRFLDGGKEEIEKIVFIKVKKEDKVKVVQGPFRDYEGVVERIDETKGEVVVSLRVFGRLTSVFLTAQSLEKIG